MPILRTVRTPRYTLMLGDCLERMKEIEPGSVDMVMTDPPYGTTQCKWDSVIPLEPMWNNLGRVVDDRSAKVFTSTQPFASMLVLSNPKGFRYEWVWLRGNKCSGHLDCKRRPLRKHELILVFSDRQSVYNPVMTDGPLRKASAGNQSTANSPLLMPGLSRSPWSSNKRYPVDVLEFNALDSRKRDHPTQKPVELMEYLIKTYTNERDLVLDFAMGSGTTGVACMNLNRRFIGIEIEEKYYRIAKERIEDAENRG